VIDKLKMQTPNITDQNIEQILKLFPNVRTETTDENGNTKTAIDFESLKQALSDVLVDDADERYRLDWPGKKASLLKANTPITKTLRPCRKDSVNFDTTENIYIEGDNFEVLKILQESYLGKIKMIYIDPPYNTGKDFIYKDNFTAKKADYEEELGVTDEEDNKLFRNTDSNGRFHSDWLSMMYERLVVARDLLKEDGAIVIHMDESEYPNLEKLLSEVFGEENNLGTIVWDKRNPKGDATGIAQQHELISFYCKNREEFKNNVVFKRPKENAQSMIDKVSQLKNIDGSLTDNVKDKYKNWLKKQDFSGGDKAYCFIDEDGDIYRPVSMAWPNKKIAPDDYFIPLIHPITKKECPIPERGWRNPSKTMEKLLKAGLILFGQDETTQPNRKYLLKENLYENISSLLYYGGSDDALLSELKIWFDTPKVVNVSKKIIMPICKADDYILDFFSGSATTAHAVMQLNAEDNGNLKFIMVQLPEETDEHSEAYKAGYETIAEIGKERIRRAGNKIVEDNKHKNGIEKLDIGFRVYKTDTTNMKDVYYHPAMLNQQDLLATQDNIKEDRTPDDLLTQVILDLGLELNLPIEKKEIFGNTVFVVQTNALVACFDDNIDFKLVDEVAKLQPFKVVFKDASFVDSKDRINVEERFKRLSPETKITVL
jgi:adenine-specific DNA-methyltransferase